MASAAATVIAPTPHCWPQRKMSANDEKHREIPIMNIAIRRRWASTRPLQLQGMELS
jgi:hypothetical protein